MLKELHVSNLALVEDIWLEFGRGMTVLTGETGTGKTVLVSALKLLLGERADSSMVREGADEALVEGRFLIDGSEVLIRRRLTAEGRSKCSIDGEMATVAMLSELLGPHVDLHGQHEHQALLSVSKHVGYLDRYMGQAVDASLQVYSEAWTGIAAARSALRGIESSLEDRDRKSDYLRFQVAEIDAASPVPGEFDELQGRLPRLRNAERLTAAVGEAWEALRDEGGASDSLSSALTALGKARTLDPALDDLASEVLRLDVELNEVSGALRAYLDSVDRDPGALDAAEIRIQQLTGLIRKYGPTVEDVLRTRESASSELALLDEGEEGLERARATLVEAEARLAAAGEALIEARSGGIAGFTADLAAAVAELALPKAAFEVARTRLPFGEWTSEGPERIEFLFASGPGESPRPLAKVASGGEVSRVMLAIKSVLGASDSVPVLVFDEIDSGIGGATALAVGRRLASLAQEHQVLVVTHLPQVAACADAHVVVEKAFSGSRTVTTARSVEGDDLTEEIARMLSGGASSTGLAHARELISSAVAERG